MQIMEQEREESQLLIPQRKRPPSPLNKWIKETKHSYQITRKDLCFIYRNIIFAKSFGELKEILDCQGATEEETKKLQKKRDSYPAIVIAVIAGVLGDIARGNLLNLTRMLQYVFPDKLSDFEVENFSNIDESGYGVIKELENIVRKLEGEDGLMIVDKLLMAEGTHEFNNNAS